MIWIFWRSNSFPFSPRLLHLDYPKSTSSSARHQEKHAQHRYQLQSQCHSSKPCVFHISPSDVLLALFLAEPEKFEISPVMERACSVTRDDEEDRHTDKGYEINRQKHDEFNDLSQVEGAVDCAFRWLSKHLYWILCITVQYPGLVNEILKALIDENRIEDVHQGFVDKERLEEKSYDDLPFS